MPDHIHDFGTGGVLVCTVCKRSAKDLAVGISGGKNVTPGVKDDGFRFGTYRDASGVLRGTDESSDEVFVQNGSRSSAVPESMRALADSAATIDPVEAVSINRMDVVAHDWNLRRRPGEDDTSLATRVRRAAATTTMRRKVPPMDWTPPKGFKLGDKWDAPARGPKIIDAAPTIEIRDGVVRAVCAPSKHKFHQATMDCKICGMNARALARKFASMPAIAEDIERTIQAIEKPPTDAQTLLEPDVPSTSGIKKVN